MGEQRGLAPLLTVDLAPVTVELNLRESGARFPCKWSSVLEIYKYKVNHYLASSVNLYRFTHFLDFPFGSIFANCLLGKHPQSPLNATCGVGCAFILNTFTY